jgi:hypothetical protein
MPVGHNQAEGLPQRPFFITIFNKIDEYAKTADEIYLLLFEKM